MLLIASIYEGLIMSKLKSRIRGFRLSSEITLFRMARLIGVTSAKLSQFECGNDGLNIDAVEKLIDIIGAPQSEWINADNEMPEPDVSVLCWVSDAGCGWIEVLYNLSGKWRRGSDSEYVNYLVSHWMPLPSQPKQ